MIHVHTVNMSISQINHRYTYMHGRNQLKKKREKEIEKKK